MTPLSDELCQEAVAAFKKCGNKAAAARFLNIPGTTLKSRLERAAQRGMAYGEEFIIPDGHVVKGVSALIDQDNHIVAQWVKTREDSAKSIEIIHAVVDELKKDLPRIKPSKAPEHTNQLLLNQYTITDSHFGMLAWGEETRSADYDLKIAEQLLIDWFTAAISMSPASQVGVFAQLGDLLHHDSLRSITPTNAHVLDADSRLQKIIRVVIRTVRRIISMLLAKHPQVHVIMALGNHDESSSCWLREMLASMYEDEPRLTVDVSPDPFYAYEWGRIALFYHHGHKRNIDNVDSVFAGKFREIYGNSVKAYGHIGHLHSAGVKPSNLMKVERHKTLAPPDAFGSLWLSDRDAQVITYHKEFGEVFRSILTPEMVMDAQKAKPHLVKSTKCKPKRKN